MTFTILAQYFEKLSSTPKRLELIDILSQLFKESKSGEIGNICYLIQGRVAPFFEPIEIGMAEKMVAQAIGQAFGKNKEDVTKLFHSKGDMGKVASELAKKVKVKVKSEKSVNDVFEELLKIAHHGGEGSVEKKVSTLSALISKLDPVSVKHVVNIPLGTLRLGIGGPTVMDALALAKTGKKEMRKSIEEAYNKTSDLGFVAETFWAKGEKGIKSVRLVVGKPVRPALAERLPNADEVIKRVGNNFAAEPKFDGFRVQVHLNRKGFSDPVATFPPAESEARLRRPTYAKASAVRPASKGSAAVSLEAKRSGVGIPSHSSFLNLSDLGIEDLSQMAHPQESKTSRVTQKTKIFSRNLEDMTHSFPDLVEGVEKEVKAKSAILEGEAIAYNPQTEEFLPFQETTKRRRKYNIEEKAKELPLVMFAFDLLFLNGKDITQKPYTERRNILEKIIHHGNQIVRIAQVRKLTNSRQILEFFNESVSEGLEGIMIKKLDSPYIAGGRGFHWIKFKRGQSGELTDTVDCVLLGIFAGKGKRTAFGVGGLLVGVYDKKKDEYASISRIGTGLTDEEFRKINEIGKKLKVGKKPLRVISKIEPTYWVEPKVVLEVFADEITKSPIHSAGEDNGVGFALRFPRVVKFREDRKAEDSTSVDEIKRMYKHQYTKKKVN